MTKAIPYDPTTTNYVAIVLTQEAYRRSPIISSCPLIVQELDNRLALPHFITFTSSMERICLDIDYHLRSHLGIMMNHTARGQVTHISTESHPLMDDVVHLINVYSSTFIQGYNLDNIPQTCYITARWLEPSYYMLAHPSFRFTFIHLTRRFDDSTEFPDWDDYLD